MSTIPVLVDESHDRPSGTLRGLSPTTLIKQIDADKLRESLSHISEQVASVLQDIKQVGDFKLKEVQVSVEISAEGGVAIVGTVNAGVGARGAMTLTFAV